MKKYTNLERIELISPGEILLEEFMKPAGITQSQLSQGLPLSTSHVHMIITGKRQITIETAIKLAAYFDNTPQFWLNLQNNYELELAERTGKLTDIISHVRTSRIKREMAVIC